ncbi:hypothetical protein HY498_01770 [Candidatus Woesearchaeota archaeon]|nr:hypothetical protein [Candidatus Woesearchaeota archaeon]
MQNKDRWTEFFKRIHARGNPEEYYSKILLCYSDERRKYHTIEHIDSCLDEFRKVYHLAEHPNELEMAIWMHDAVLDIRSINNEELSAGMAIAISNNMGMKKEFCDLVRRIILATKHKHHPSDIESQLMADIDLAIFGKSKKEFNDYEDKIRQEYESVYKETFRIERIKILQIFIDRQYIYCTDFFRQKYENRAIRNLKRSIKRLKLR